MINLLPPEGKKRVRTEYWVRVVAAYFALTGLVFLIGAILLLPTYFYISFQASALAVSGQELEGDTQSYEALEKEIQLANDISRLLVDTPEYIEASAVIDEIYAVAGDRIDVNSIRILKEGRMITSVVVSGSALDRSALVAFRDGAEASEYFATVELPLSNLAEDRDIPFSLTLEPSSVLQTAI